jgi:transcriptional regulator with XRE-family HTH domain
MAVFAGTDFKKWRESQDITAAELAERISCDATTIYRYESGKLKPNPDIAYQICEALGDTSKWCDWMRTEYPISYGRVHPEQPQLDIRGALLSLYAEMSDVSSLQNAIFKDAADARIDDKEVYRSFRKEITELLQSTQRVLNIMQNEADGNGA